VLGLQALISCSGSLWTTVN